jgi:hypothetical protein
MYAMAVPLIPNKVDAWKVWIRECQGSRREEFDSFNERMGITLHRVWLTQSRQTPEAIVVLDGPGVKNFLRKLTTSKEPFDRWFRERITEYHGIDFSKTEVLPPSELILDYAPSYVGVGEK